MKIHIDHHHYKHSSLKGCNNFNRLQMDSKLFISSVEQAVSLSLSSQKCLVVYNGREQDDEGWLTKWLDDQDSLKLLRDKAVWLKLRPGSEQFTYFEQLFPSVIIPSVYVIKQGQIVSMIQGPEASINQLADVLGISLGGGNAISKSFKDEVAETTQRKHLEDIKKQKKIAREERERILQLVRADRAERKAMDLHSIGSNDEVQDNIKDVNKLHTKTCVLMVRLTNSSTLTGQFDSKETLNDVRKWVDEHRTDGDCLYAFHRNIPRVTFTDSEELKGLNDLQLLPRSVLILKPLENSYTNVAEAKGPGLLGKVFTGLSSWWSRGGDDSSGVDSSNASSAGSFGSSGNGSSNSTHHQTTQELRSENTEERNNVRVSGSETSPRASLLNNEEFAIDSPVSSRFESPASYAIDQQATSTSNPSDLNLPSRCVTPNVYQFVNKDDDEKEKSTYNGNTINLEKKKDDD